MKPDLYIHCGMMKTGSSSIQDTMAAIDLPDVEFVRWHQGTNHGGPFQFAFGSPGSDWMTMQSGLGLSDEELARKRVQFQNRLRTALKRASKPKLLISAEEIGACCDRDAIVRLVGFVRPFVANIFAMAYVRPPAGFFESKFQQRCRALPFVEGAAWHDDGFYVSQLGAVRDAFAGQACTFRVFDKDDFPEGDVVKDFGTWLGVDIPTDGIARSNESVSLPITALLYQSDRRMAVGFRDHGLWARQIKNAFIGRLRRYPSSERLVFSRSYRRELLDGCPGDRAFLTDEMKVGDARIEGPPDPEDVVDDLSQLRSVVIRHAVALCDFLVDDIRRLSQGSADVETRVERAQEADDPHDVVIELAVVLRDLVARDYIAAQVSPGRVAENEVKRIDPRL